MLTMIPAVSYSGLIDPVSSLSGFGRVLGEIYPSTWFITAARGAFSKAFGMAELAGPMLAMGIAIPVIIGLQYAYVVFDHHYYDAMAKLMPFLEAQQIYPRGRYGSWTYNSMEDCLMLGREVASLLGNRLSPGAAPKNEAQ
jgi:hypothetical protein